ncbi:TonB-dependent receptor [Dialister invisus]|uniref:TonB-dependent receptor n=1 Tax=Dialister invisus TaxID=218538 RepID=UPI0026711481|nr:TonB-dependent siderophore receptor [Dialister invisus]
MKKKLLAIAVAAAAGAALCGITADAAVYQLDEIIVNGDKYTDDTIMPGGKTDRRIHFGLYGNMDLMDVPANIASYTEKTIKQNYIPARTFMNTVTNNPSIMVGGASTNNNVELQIRGSAFNTHDMTMDGLPGMMAMGIIPMNWVEKIDVVTGPNIVLSGTGINQSVSGYINFVPKIAKDKPILAISETYSSHRLFNHAIDWGQRFGDDHRYGIRINAERYSGTTSFSNETLHGNDLYIHFDQRTKSSNTSVMYGHDHVINHGMPEVLNVINNWGGTVTKLPDPSKVVENFMPTWSDLSHQRHVYTLSHEQQLNGHVTFYLKGGYEKLSWPGYYDQKPVLLNDAGDYNFGKWGFGSAQDSKWSRRSLTTGFLFNIDTPSVSHKINFGFEMLSNGWYYMNASAKRSKPEGNIYTGIWKVNDGAPMPSSGPWYISSRKINRSLILTDTISAMDGNLRVILGARRQNIQTKSFNTSGALTKKYDKTKTSPAVGVLYKLTPTLSVYGNYSEGLTTLSIPSGTKNEKEVLPPVQTKQYEFGLKKDFKDWVTTLSFFHIKQPTGITNTDNYYVLDGETRNRGVEWNISGKVSSNLTLTGGLMLLDAKYKRTQNGANDGHRVHGTPKLNATLALDWDTPVKGLSINGRVVHFGKSYADTGNKVNVSSWTRFDLGATYDTELAKIPTTFSFNAYNLFDRKYWSTATTVWADGMVMLNPGRTYILSATMHF